MERKGLRSRIGAEKSGREIGGGEGKRSAFSLLGGGEGRGRESESRAVRQSRAIPQSGGFEKYLTIHGEGGVHASPNIVATSAANPATPSNPLRVFCISNSRRGYAIVIAGGGGGSIPRDTFQSDLVRSPSNWSCTKTSVERILFSFEKSSIVPSTPSSMLLPVSWLDDRRETTIQKITIPSVKILFHVFLEKARSMRGNIHSANVEYSRASMARARNEHVTNRRRRVKKKKEITKTGFVRSNFIRPPPNTLSFARNKQIDLERKRERKREGEKKKS